MRKTIFFVIWISFTIGLFLNADPAGFTISGTVAIQRTGILHLALVSEASAKGDNQAKAGIDIVIGPDEIKNKSVRFEFKNIPEGVYFIRAHEDLNGNGVMDYGLFGIPMEPWGTYRWSRPFMSGPKIAEMLFTVNGDIADADFRVE